MRAFKQEGIDAFATMLPLTAEVAGDPEMAHAGTVEAEQRQADAFVAKFDPAGRLILVRGGKLFAVSVADDLSVTETELADFNDMTFEPIPPPDWATQWPDAP